MTGASHSPISRREALRLSLGVGATALVAACSPGSTPAAPGATSATSAAPSGAASGEKVQLVFRQFDPTNQVQGLQKAVDDWNTRNPNVQVRMETTAVADAQNQYVREVQAGSGPDVQHLAFVWVADLGKNGLLQPLDDLLQSSPPGKGIDDFIATDLAQVNGKTFGLPWTVDTNAVAYRPDLLDKAGVTFPDSWDDLLTAAQKLTAGQQSGFYFPGGSSADASIWFYANYYLWSNGKTFVQQTADGKWDTGATPQDVAAAMTYFNTFFSSGATPKSLISVNDPGDPSIVGALGRGDCAMVILPPITFRTAEAQSQTALQTGVIPRGAAKRIAHLGGRMLGLNPKGKHLQQAWEFTRFLVSPDVFFTFGHNQYPAQKALLDPAKFPKQEQGYVEMLPQAITFGSYIASPARVSSMWEATNREFGAVFSGQKTPEQAGADLVAAMKALLERGQG
jgi:multiple sugar transport system substrate-binding protein